MFFNVFFREVPPVKHQCSSWLLPASPGDDTVLYDLAVNAIHRIEANFPANFYELAVNAIHRIQANFPATN